MEAARTSETLVSYDKIYTVSQPRRPRRAYFHSSAYILDIAEVLFREI
jgi:hypothetical protein